MIVIDASVASKWILKGEKDQDKALLLLNRHLKGEEKIIVPDLLFYEIANTIVTKTELTKQHLERSLEVIFKTGLVIHRPVFREILQAAILAKKHKTSAYDMLYAMVAKNNKTVLVTADEKFFGSTKFPQVKLLSQYSP